MTLNFFEGLIENTFLRFLKVPKGHFSHTFGQFGPFFESK
jgi:hypothetical protein